MRIGIDIDCVCNNLVHEWLYRLNDKHNLSVEYTDIKTYNIKDAFPTLTTTQIYEPLDDVDFWSSLKPTIDSYEYIKRLLLDNHNIKLITATDVKYMPTKVDWVLKNYSFLNKRDIYMVHDKTWINTDILLDDCIDNLENGEYIGVCYSQPWNLEYKSFRVTNWNEFYQLVNEINKTFKEVTEYEFI